MEELGHNFFFFKKGREVGGLGYWKQGEQKITVAW